MLLPYHQQDKISQKLFIRPSRTCMYMVVSDALQLMQAILVSLSHVHSQQWYGELGSHNSSKKVFSKYLLPYSGKLLREQTFTNFMVLWLFAKLFFAKFGDVTFFGAEKTSNPQKFSPQKSYFSPICNSFLPRKFPVYTVFSTMSERNPLYGTIIHLSQRQHLTKGVLDNIYMSLTALL